MDCSWLFYIKNIHWIITNDNSWQILKKFSFFLDTPHRSKIIQGKFLFEILFIIVRAMDLLIHHCISKNDAWLYFTLRVSGYIMKLCVYLLCASIIIIIILFFKINTSCENSSFYQGEFKQVKRNKRLKPSKRVN